MNLKFGDTKVVTALSIFLFIFLWGGLLFSFLTGIEILNIPIAHSPLIIWSKLQVLQSWGPVKHPSQVSSSTWTLHMVYDNKIYSTSQLLKIKQMCCKTLSFWKVGEKLAIFNFPADLMTWSFIWNINIAAKNIFIINTTLPDHCAFTICWPAYAIFAWDLFLCTGEKGT